MLDEEAAKSIASVLERSVKSDGDRVPAPRNAKFTDMPMADNSFFMAASFCVWLRGLFGLGIWMKILSGRS